MKYKYETTNNLNTFAFHDAVIEGVTFENNNMIWNLYCVNITKENNLNTYPNDMKLGKCKLVFKNIENIKGKFWGSSILDENNNIIGKKEDIILNEKEIIDQLKKYNEYVNDILYLKETNIGNSKYNVLIECNGYDIMSLSFDYETSIILWNEFEGKSWYVDFNNK